MAAYHLLSLALWRFRESVPVRSSSLSSWLGEWAGSDHHLFQWAESRNRQTDRWPWDSRRKGPFNFQTVCLRWCSPNPVFPQLPLQLVLSSPNSKLCS